MMRAMSRAAQLRKQYSIAVTRRVDGAACVGEGLVPAMQRDKATRHERDLIWLEAEIAFYGVSPAAFLYRQFALEDSEGYLVAAEPPPEYLDCTLQPGQSGRGGLLFALYTDVTPVRLWFDTGLPFDESGAPLMLEVPMGEAPTPAAESWQDRAARGLDQQLSDEHSLAAEGPDVASMLQRVSQDLGLPYKKLANGYMFRLQLPGDRKQNVLMSFGGKDEDGAPLIKFVTLCAPATDSGANHEVFLRANPRLSYGAIGIAKIEGADFYVMTDTQLVETADTEELIKSIRYLARKGDELEHDLTGGQDIR